MCRVDLVFRQSFSIEHLADMLRSNPRYEFSFSLPARKRKFTGHDAERITYQWVHKRCGGEIELTKHDDVFWAETRGENDEQLVWSFASWLIDNAGEIVDSIEIHIDDLPRIRMVAPGSNPELHNNWLREAGKNMSWVFLYGNLDVCKDGGK